ncbi:MAG TPA: phage holin family protein [Solirubrobacteraceae bacterium]|nr:phage holin family protein [Solirubrobacteraceae bacterium]
MADNQQRRNGAPEPSEPPIGELVKQLSEQTSALVRQEVELAKAELTEKGKKTGIGAGMFGGAGLLGLFALGALTAAAIAALDAVMPLWAAALIVAAVYGAMAGVLALMGRNKVQEAGPPVPAQTIETVKEDVQWTKQRAQEGRR